MSAASATAASTESNTATTTGNAITNASNIIPWKYEPAGDAVSATSKWIATSRPQRVDMIAQLGAADHFLIDGDSLFIEALLNQHCDWSQTQPLHIVYLAEEFLTRYRRFGGNFTVVFFQHNTWWWKNRPQFELARTLLLQRLLALSDQPTSKFSVAVFQDYKSKKFKPYCAHTRPEFALVNDGCQFDQLLDKSVAQAAKASIRALAMFLLSRCLHIAFSSRQTEMNNTVYSFAIRVTTAMQASEDIETLIEDVTTGFSKKYYDNDKQDVAPVPAQDVAQKLLQHCQSKNLSARDAVTLLALVSFLKNNNNNTGMAKIHLLSNCLQAMLPLSKRALNAGRSTLVEDYLNKFSHYASPVAFGLPTIVPATGLSDEYADMMDGHLLARVAEIVCKDASGGDEKKVKALFGDSVIETCSQTWQLLCDNSGKNKPSSFFPIFACDCSGGSSEVPETVFDIQVPVAPSSASTTNATVPSSTAASATSASATGQQQSSSSNRNIPLLKALGGTAAESCTIAKWNDAEVTITQSGWKQYLPAHETIRRLDEYPDDERRDQKQLTKFVRDQRNAAESMNVKAVDLELRGKQVEAAKTRDSVLKLQLENTLSSEIKQGAKVAEHLRILESDSRRGNLQHTALDTFLKSCADDVPLEEASFVSFREYLTNTAKTSENRFLFVEHNEGGVLSLTKVKEMDAKMKLAAYAVYRRHCALKSKQFWLYQLWTHWDTELREANDAGRIPNMNILVNFFLELQNFMSTLKSYKVALDTRILSTIHAMVVTLNFGEAYNQLVAEEMARTLPSGQFRPENIALPNSTELSLILKKFSPWCPARFQLVIMGEMLERERGIPDKRMPFPLDLWQKKLLDVVDEGYSAVVTAPTSSGKTFIALYAMAKALRANDTDVVVYVCPNRALVNQAVTDSWARFGHKDYGRNGLSVVGILGGDNYIFMPFDCQVLVTIPEVLESILLSPEHQQWAQRLKFVVFDEIHSIESTSSGAIWERLMMSVPCPFVALSATLGNTAELVAWLNRGRKAVPDGKPVILVPGAQDAKIDRFNDIEKFVVLSEPVEVHNVSTVPKDYSFLERIHPLSCVSFEMLRSKGVEDLRLVPSEVVELYDAMHAALTKCEHFSVFAKSQSGLRVAEALSALEPGKYFASRRNISKQEARRYEDTVVHMLINWAEVADAASNVLIVPTDSSAIINSNTNSNVTSPTTASASAASSSNANAEGGETVSSSASTNFTKIPLEEGDHVQFYEIVQSILAHFRSVITSKENSLIVASESNEIDEENQLPYIHPESPEYVKQQLLPLIVALHDKKMTPAIVFSFTEEDCEAYTDAIVNLLETAEGEFRQSKAFEDWVSDEKAKFEAAQRETADQSGAASRSVVSVDGEGNVTVEKVENQLELKEYVVPEILPMYTFKPQYSHISASEWNEFLRDAERFNLKETHLRALKRGIAVHHSGITGRNRRIIERLFRLRALPVVICTETLALGVHSPCKTCVIAGDNMRLTTSTFRQMSGRAGRRGQDFLGNCVFLGVPLRRIERLLTSDLDRLKGHVIADGITMLRFDSLINFAPETMRANAEELLRRNFVEPLLLEGRSRLPKGMFEKFMNIWSRSFINWAAEVGFTSSRTGQVSVLGSMVARVCTTLREVHAGPGSFLFAYLLGSGALHHATAGLESEGCIRALYNVMSLLFTTHSDFNTPLEIHRSILENDELFEQQQNTTTAENNNNKSKVCHSITLPSWNTVLDGALNEPINNYNNRVIQCAVEALRESAEAFGGESTLGTKLPLSEYQLSSSNSSSSSSSWEKCDAAKSIAACANTNISVRHPLSAISGANDEFKCVEDLCRGVREGLYVDSQMLPTLDLRDSGRHDGEAVLMNAAVVDYLVNGYQNENGAPCRKYLWQYNGLVPRDSWLTMTKNFKVVDNLVDFFGKDYVVAPGSVKTVEEKNVFSTDDHVMDALLGYQDRMTELAASLTFSSASVRQFDAAMREERRAKNKAKRKPVAR